MTDNQNDNQDNQSQQGGFPGWAIVTLSATFMGFVALDFFHAPDQMTLTPNILVGMALVIVVVFASSFDSLSVAQLITLKRTAKEETGKRQQAEDRVEKMATQLVNMSTSVNTQVHSDNSTHNHFGPEVVPASPDDKANDDRDEQEENRKQSNAEHQKEGVAPKVNVADKTSRLRIDYSKVEDLAFEHLSTELKIPKAQFSRDVKLTEPDIEDRITTRPAIFDAFAQIGDENIFVEIKTVRPTRSLLTNTIRIREQLRRYITLADSYGKSSRFITKMVIILVVLDEDEQAKQSNTSSKRSVKDNLERYFAPVIERGLLEIMSLNINSSDVEKT